MAVLLCALLPTPAKAHTECCDTHTHPSSTPLLHSEQRLLFLGITNFWSAFRRLRLKTRRFSGDI